MRQGVLSTSEGLRFEQQGAMGSDRVTLAEIRLPSAAAAKIHVIYFPSRFDTAVDKACKELLRKFADNTPETTRIDFWDTRDNNIGVALVAFEVEHAPAVVLTTGFEVRPDGSLDMSTSYQITFNESSVLEDQGRFMEAVGVAYDLMERGEAWEIAVLIRKGKRQALLAKLSEIRRGLRDELIALHPKFSAGPVSLQVG